ncbi:MAG: universal stress protein [Candidatus Binatia bacterium]
MIGTHGRTGRLEQLVGSVAAAVVRMARRPVLTVPPSASRSAASRPNVA